MGPSALLGTQTLADVNLQSCAFLHFGLLRPSQTIASVGMKEVVGTRETVGVLDGDVVGLALGVLDGAVVGLALGALDGNAVGLALGDGESDGIPEGG